MKLEDFVDPPRQDFAPRPNASQAVAAQNRRRHDTEPITPIAPRRQLTPRQQILAGCMALLIALAMIGISYQLSGGAPKPLPTPQPTIAPTDQPMGLSAPPTAAPAPTSAPTATITPSRTPVLTQPAQSGRGLSQSADPATPEPSATPEPPTYLDIVAAQAPHSPRGDGQAGPSGGDWVQVAPISEAQAEIIRQQTPHKVR